MVTLLNDTALAVYTAYQQELKLVGGQYERGPDHDMKTWSRCANLIMELKLDPQKFVQAQFEAISKNARRTLRPKHLFSNRDRAMKNYAKLVSDSGNYEADEGQDDPDARVKAHLAAMESTLERLVRIMVPKRYEAVENLLMESTLPFTAWFRVLVAPTLTGDLADRYLEEARLQVMQDIPLRRLIEDRDVTGRYDTRRLSV